MLVVHKRGLGPKNFWNYFGFHFHKYNVHKERVLLCIKSWHLNIWRHKFVENHKFVEVWKIVTLMPQICDLYCHKIVEIY